MADNLQKLDTLTVENKEFYERALLERLLKNCVFRKFTQKKKLPKNSGDTISFRRFNSLTPATTPLTEGVTPDGSNLSITELKATLKQYGDYVKISDKLDMVGIDPALTEAAELLGEQAGETLDTVARDVYLKGTNVLYCGTNAVSSKTVSGKLTSDDILKAKTFLARENVKRINGYYIGFISPDVAYDLAKDALWQDVSKYNGGTNILNGEIGKIHGVRFIETTNALVNEVDQGTTESPKVVNVHNVLIIGQNALGEVDLEGEGKPEMIVKDLGSAGTNDPLNQRASAGWKCMDTFVRLNELALIRLECLATIN
mgnify:CR=1 FL=1